MYLTIIVLIYVVISFFIFKQISLIRRFRKTRTTNPGAARTLSSLGLSPSPLFKQLVTKNVVHEVKGNKYYLELEDGLLFAKKRRGLFYTVTFIFLIIFFFVWNNF